MYELVAADAFRSKNGGRYNMSERVTLPPPSDGEASANESGLPRRLVFNCIVPAEAPSLAYSKTDGSCYQMVLYFTATAERLQSWVDGGCAASRLFSRWVADGGVDKELKERLKLLVKMENLRELGTSFAMLERYNGKPALITKSGAIYRGPDYIEVCMNTFRFAFMTKKGVHSLMHRIPEFDLHAAIVRSRHADACPCATRHIPARRP